MSAIVVGGRAYAAGLYWLGREGSRATARTARRLNRPWCVHHGGRTGFAAEDGGLGEGLGLAGPGAEGLPALAPVLLERIEDGFWMALVEGEADSPAAGGPGGGERRYALVKARDGAVLADGDEVFDDRAAALAAFERARNLGWTLHATPGLLEDLDGKGEVTPLEPAELDAAASGMAAAIVLVRAAPAAGRWRVPPAALIGLAALAAAVALWLQWDALVAWLVPPPAAPAPAAALPEPEVDVAVDTAALIAACRRALVENPSFMPGWRVERIDCAARFADAEIVAAVPGLAGRAMLLVRWQLAPGHAGAVQRRVAEAHLARRHAAAVSDGRAWAAAPLGSVLREADAPPPPFLSLRRAIDRSFGARGALLGYARDAGGGWRITIEDPGPLSRLAALAGGIDGLEITALSRGADGGWRLETRPQAPERMTASRLRALGVAAAGAPPGLGTARRTERRFRMERRIITTPRRRSARSGFKAVLLAGAGAVAMTGAAPASAQVPADERAYRREALAHAGAVEAAWRRLETFIMEESAAAAAWPGAVPPAETGWRASWTLRGLEARYCDDILLVYLAPAALKGTGNDHRVVHAAPHVYGDGQRPVLHWLENGVAEGGAGRGTVTLPACLSEASRGGPLPSGRAALAGEVRDPFLNTVERVTRERRQEPCPDGTHGEGRTLIREVTREHDGRGDPVGTPGEGPWEVLIDLCRDDFSQWEHYTLPCHWDAGPPHNRRMEGREVWRRLRTVTAEGESLGAPEFLSTSCWTGNVVPPPPTPEVEEASHAETRSGSCPAGYEGSIGYRRTVTLRSTRFPWDEAPVTQTITGAWTVASDDCRRAVEPDVDDHDRGEGPDGGAGGPGDDGCGPCDPHTTAIGDICNVDGIGGPGDDGGGDGDCFLTTAVVERRGEPDDGPALTALRAFRNRYMTRTAERRVLVAEYYAVAPAIVAAIPPDHADWERIAGAVDAAVDAIAAGADDEAFDIYAALVRRLKTDWLGAGNAGGAGGRP